MFSIEINDIHYCSYHNGSDLLWLIYINLLIVSFLTNSVLF